MITTFTLRQVDPLGIDPRLVSISDIAHALALCNRFNGHTREPVSVAQHSVYVSRLCDHEHALQGLLHDASEAYLCDVPRRLKRSDAFSAYREAEAEAKRVVWSVFGCAAEQHESVTAADVLMARVEGWWAFGDQWPGAKHGPPTSAERMAVGPWEPWSWQESERAFLDRFSGLCESPPANGL